MPPGFADEVKAVGRSENVPETPETPAADGAGESAANPQAEKEAQQAAADMFNGQPPELPVGEAPVTPEAKAQADAQKAKTTPEEKPAAKIKIGTREFSTPEEAIRYAEELELARIQDEGFKEGYKAAKPDEDKEKTPQQKALEEEVEEMLWENPKQAVKTLIEGVENRIRKEHEAWITAQRQATEKAQQTRQMWDDFYTQNSDLSESRDVVDFLLKKNWNDLGKLKVPEALDKLAEIARRQLRITKQSAAPEQELQSKRAIVPGASSESTQPQQQATEEESLDFVKQLASLRRRNAGA